MPDIFHEWDTDLFASATGDLATVDGTTLGEQRVLRRLLTNPGDYIWHLDYGAGLRQKIGTIQNADELRGLILAQMALEAVVQPGSAVVTVTPLASNLSQVAINIQYQDAYTGQQASLSFDLAE